MSSALTTKKQSIGCLPAAEDAAGTDLGMWAGVGRLMLRLGATQVYRLGAGVGVLFPKFALETQVYPTRGVVAIGSDSFFKLSSAVDEPRAFSLTLHRATVGGAVGSFTPRPGDVLKITFAPVPDRGDAVDERELARRYALGLAYLLDDAHFRGFLELPGKSDRPLDERFMRMLDAP